MNFRPTLARGRRIWVGRKRDARTITKQNTDLRIDLDRARVVSLRSCRDIWPKRQATSVFARSLFGAVRDKERERQW